MKDDLSTVEAVVAFGALIVLLGLALALADWATRRRCRRSEAAGEKPKKRLTP